jgi:hypothetical protein
VSPAFDLFRPFFRPSLGASMGHIVTRGPGTLQPSLGQRLLALSCLWALVQARQWHYSPASVTIGLASYGYWNKFPQTWWLEVTQVYHLTVLEVRLLTLNCWKGLCLRETPGEGPFPPPRGNLYSLTCALSLTTPVH